MINIIGTLYPFVKLAPPDSELILIVLFLWFSLHQWTPVYMAAASGSIELLKYLVDVKQADISIKDNTCVSL